MTGVRWLLGVVAVAGLMAGCGTSPPYHPRSISPAIQPASSASPLPAASADCLLAFDVGSTTFPDTASGYAASVSATDGYGTVHHMAHVTITNTGSVGFTLNTYAIEIDYQNSPAGYQQLDAGTFLAPGESFDHWIYLDESSSFPAMSSSAFESSVCRVPATS